MSVRQDVATFLGIGVEDVVIDSETAGSVVFGLNITVAGLEAEVLAKDKLESDDVPFDPALGTFNKGPSETVTPAIGPLGLQWLYW